MHNPSRCSTWVCRRPQGKAAVEGLLRPPSVAWAVSSIRTSKNAAAPRSRWGYTAQNRTGQHSTGTDPEPGESACKPHLQGTSKPSEDASKPNSKVQGNLCCDIQNSQPGSGRACGSIEGSPCHHSTTSCCCTRWHGCKGTTAQAAIDRATKVRRSVLRTGGNSGQLHAATAAAAIPCRRLHHPARFCITQCCLSAMPCCSHPVPVHSQSR
jgi:hypothetical protein